MMFLMFMLYRTPAVLLALTLHEYAHGYVALRCGDTTAQSMGRLSLNPLRHLEPIGVIFMFLFGFGWAKAVPVNPYNFRNGYKDDLKVSLAGVTVNFILYVCSFLVMIGLNRLMWNLETLPMISSMYRGAEGLDSVRDFVSMNGEGFYALLYGFISSDPDIANNGVILTQFMRAPWIQYVLRFFMQFSMINLGLAVFNLFPIPPLDGFHVVNDIVLKGRLTLSPKVFGIARIALLALCLTGALSSAISAVIEFVAGGVESVFAFLM